MAHGLRPYPPADEVVNQDVAPGFFRDDYPALLSEQRGCALNLPIVQNGISHGGTEITEGKRNEFLCASVPP